VSKGDSETEARVVAMLEEICHRTREELAAVTPTAKGQEAFWAAMATEDTELVGVLKGENEA